MNDEDREWLDRIASALETCASALVEISENVAHLAACARPAEDEETATFQVSPARPGP